jgi:hypothetical protein
MKYTYRMPVTILLCDVDAEDRELTKQALEAAHISNVIMTCEDGEQLHRLYQRGA